MKSKIVGIFICMLLIGTVVSVVNSVSACTGFTAIDGENVLVGNNEDWHLPDPYIRVQPPEGDKNGYLIFEYGYPLPWDPNFVRPFGGMNDKGLFFDAFGTPEDKIKFDASKPLLLYDPTLYIMEELSTVDEVVNYIQSYNIWLLGFLGFNNVQFFWADKTGNSVIIEGNDIVYREGDFQVVTNFYQTHPELGNYPCWRYDTAVSMLENMTDLSVYYFRDICNATHQEYNMHPTQYSYIYDLKNGIIYLYHYHDYENMIEFNLQEEFLKGENYYFLPSLFEPENNQPPAKPNPPTGKISGNVKTSYSYKVDDTTDPDNNMEEIYYMFDWGDGTFSQLYNRYYIGYGFVTHEWKKQGNYNVRVKAKDIYGAESEWSDPLGISMPKTKVISLQLFLQRFFQRFPFFEKIINQIII
ncbi:MAG: hypothetical protein BV457_02865 [Thermoplasmata archaeon M9B1D]|nr:MAG: hypothetical protein BV457_02865 [Thermoplasmata archaeon M9B1D]PNX50015.1 MAG: hypothetical protein BV456_08130 [Thermoplasmata archaeon M8B2D]